MLSVIVLACFVGASLASEICTLETVTTCAKKAVPDFEDIMGKIMSGSIDKIDAKTVAEVFQKLCSAKTAFIDCLGGKQSAIDCVDQLVGQTGIHGVGKASFETLDYICQPDVLKEITDNMQCAIDFYRKTGQDPETVKCVTEQMGGDVGSTNPSDLVCKAANVFKVCIRGKLEASCGKALTKVTCQMYDIQSAAIGCPSTGSSCDA